jgi:hypothetical protein
MLTYVERALGIAVIAVIATLHFQVFQLLRSQYVSLSGLTLQRTTLIPAAIDQ